MRMIMTGLFMGRVNFDLSHPDLQGLVELVRNKNLDLVLNILIFAIG